MQVKTSAGFLNLKTAELSSGKKQIILTEEKFKGFIPELNNLGYEIFERQYRKFHNVRLTYHYVLQCGVYKRISKKEFDKVCEDSLVFEGISEKGYTYYTEYLYMQKK